MYSTDTQNTASEKFVTEHLFGVEAEKQSAHNAELQIKENSEI